MFNVIKFMLNDFLSLCTQEFIGLNLYPTQIDSPVSTYYIDYRIKDDEICWASGKNSFKRQDQNSHSQFVLPLL